MLICVTLTSMKNQVQITLDIPPKELWANRNCHWRAKAPVAKNARLVACQAMTDEMERMGTSTKWKKASLSMQFLFKDMRRRDVYNAAQAMKASIDGCVDAGLVPDDDWQHLEGGGLMAGLDRENPRVIMSFQRLA